MITVMKDAIVKMPVSGVKELFESYLDYKVRIKELDVQIHSIKEQAAVMHHKIDSHTILKLKELEAHYAFYSETLSEIRDFLRSNQNYREELMIVQNRFFEKINNENITTAEQKKMFDLIDKLRSEFSELTKSSQETLCAMSMHVFAEKPTISLGLDNMLL